MTGIRWSAVRGIRAVISALLIGGGLTIAAAAALPASQAVALGPSNCNDTWNVTASGSYNWNTPADWSTGSDPTASQVACLTNAGTYTVDANGAISVAGIVIGSGVATNRETLQVQGECGTNAVFTTTDAATTPDAIESTGQVQMESTGCSNTATLSVGALTESSGGELTTTTNSGNTMFITGNITTDGTTSIGETTQYSGGTWDNAGAMSIATGDTLTVTTSPSTFTDDTSGSVTSTGTGQLVVDGGNTYNQGNGTTSGNPVLLTGPSAGVSLHYTGNGASSVWTEGTGTVDGNMSTGQDLQVTAVCGDNAVETVDASLTSNGAIDMQSTGCSNTATLEVTSGDTLTVGSSGTFTTTTNAGNTMFITGNVTSEGTTNISEGTQYSEGTWNNEGAVNIADGDTFTVVTATPVATFTNGTGGSIVSSGTNKTGQLVVDSGNTYNQGNGTTSGEPVLLSGSVALHYTGTGNSTVWTEGSGTFDGAMASGQTLQITGVCGTNAVETEDASLTSAGTIDLESTGCSNSATLAVATGDALTSTGTLGTIQVSGNPSEITGNVDTSGTVSIGQNTGYAEGTWINTGAIGIANGVSLTASSGTPKATFENNGGSITSTASGTGQLVIDAGNTYKQGNGTTSGEPVLLAGTSTAVALTYTGSGASTVESEGTGTLTGTMAAGQTLQVTGVCGNNAQENLGANVTSNGTIDLNVTGCSNTATINAPKPDVLTIGKTGTLDSESGSGNLRYIEGNVTVLKKGTVLINSGTDYVPIKKGVFTNEGSLTIASSVDLVMTSVKKAVFLNEGKGAITGSGQLQVNGLSTFEESGTKATITGTPVLVDGAKLDLAGGKTSTVDVEGASTFVGNVGAGQTVNVVGVCGTNAVLTAAAAVTNSGTINLQSTGCSNTAQFADTATLTNATTGDINTAGGRGLTSIAANIENNGTIGPSGEANLAIDGNLTDSSTAVFDVNVNSGNAADSLALSSGDTAVLAGTVVAVPAAGFTPASGFAANIVTTSGTGSISGTFASVGPAGWSVTYTTTTATLKFT
ncbi:MAG: hypothetical protein WAM97_18675 [Acidimicrobiales bacterium]